MFEEATLRGNVIGFPGPGKAQAALPNACFPPRVYPPKTVYFGGPITGLSYQEARHSWRYDLAGLLSPHIYVVSPMRAKQFLKDEKVLKGDPQAYADMPMSTARGILTRDSYDVRTCDAIVVNFSYAERVSIGSVHEIGMAYVLRKPIILIMEKDGGNPHHHAFITESAGYWVEKIEEAAHIVNALLTPGV